MKIQDDTFEVGTKIYDLLKFSKRRFRGWESVLLYDRNVTLQQSRNLLNYTRYYRTVMDH